MNIDDFIKKYNLKENDLQKAFTPNFIIENKIKNDKNYLKNEFFKKLGLTKTEDKSYNLDDLAKELNIIENTLNKKNKKTEKENNKILSNLNIKDENISLLNKKIIDNQLNKSQSVIEEINDILIQNENIEKYSSYSKFIDVIKNINKLNFLTEKESLDNELFNILELTKKDLLNSVEQEKEKEISSLKILRNLYK